MSSATLVEQGRQLSDEEMFLGATQFHEDMDHYEELSRQVEPTLLDRGDAVLVSGFNKAKHNAGPLADATVAGATAALLTISSFTGGPASTVESHRQPTPTITEKAPAEYISLATEATELSTTPQILARLNNFNTQSPENYELKPNQAFIAPKTTVKTSEAPLQSATAPATSPSASASAESTTTTVPPATPINHTIALEGDSLLAGPNENGLETDLQEEGWTVEVDDAMVGANVSDALRMIQNDAPEIKLATTVVDEIAVNECEVSRTSGNCEPQAVFEGQLQQEDTAIRAEDPNLETLDQVNTHLAFGNENQSINQAIAAEAGPLDYRILDWNAEVTDNPQEYILDPEQGLHPISDVEYGDEAAWLKSDIGPAQTAPQPLAVPSANTPASTEAPEQSHASTSAQAPTTTTTEAPKTAPTTTTPPAPTTTTTTTAPAPAPPSAPATPNILNAELDPKSVEQEMRYLVVNLGYSVAGAAGILGNALGAESGALPSIPGDLNPERLQGSPYGSETPISALSQATITNPDMGYGELQEDPISKLLNFASGIGQDPTNPDVQMLFFYTQVKGSDLDAALRSSDITAQQAATDVMMLFERPQGSDGDPIYGAAAESLPWRQAAAQAIYDTYAPMFAAAEAPQPAPAPAPAPTPTTTITTSPPQLHTSPTPAPKPTSSNSNTVTATTLSVSPSHPLVSKPEKSPTH